MKETLESKLDRLREKIGPFGLFYTDFSDEWFIMPGIDMSGVEPPFGRCVDHHSAVDAALQEGRV